MSNYIETENYYLLRVEIPSSRKITLSIYGICACVININSIFLPAVSHIIHTKGGYHMKLPTTFKHDILLLCLGATIAVLTALLANCL